MKNLLLGIVGLVALVVLLPLIPFGYIARFAWLSLEVGWNEAENIVQESLERVK